jgi:outer membrane protein OmpA-like peptidoglycan-associated protein
MSRSRRAAVLALAALAAATAGPLARAQNTAEVRDLVLEVRDLDITVTSLDSTVSRSENGRRIDVVLSADVLFAFNRARLTPKATSRIEQAVTELKARRPSRVTVAGYTDSKGSDAYNLGLSRRRAAAVAARLRRRLGPGLSIAAVGKGEADPVQSNTKKDGSDDPRARARNRRVEITFPKR